MSPSPPFSALAALILQLAAGPARALSPHKHDRERPGDGHDGIDLTADTPSGPESELFTFWSPPGAAAVGARPHGIWVLAYETNLSDAPLGSFLYEQLADQMRGLVQPEILGQGTSFQGFSTKHHLAATKLRSIHPDELVVLSDYADVVLNLGLRGNDTMEEFRLGFERLTKDMDPNAVVISAEAQCCVGALSYVKPGELFGPSGNRTGRACNSGAANCKGMRKGTLQWTHFQNALAVKRGATTDYTFLNAGLIAGRAGSLIKILDALQLESDEDDQAVMTDFYYRHPDMFVLDYNQTLFGNARWPLKDGCVFDFDEGRRQFVQRDTGTRPLFLHTSGKYYSCLRSMAQQLGWVKPADYEKRWPRAHSSSGAARLPLLGALLASALAMVG